MGYGAMQLAGPQVWGPPRDVDGAMAVQREAAASLQLPPEVLADLDSTGGVVEG